MALRAYLAAIRKLGKKIRTTSLKKLSVARVDDSQRAMSCSLDVGVS